MHQRSHLFHREPDWRPAGIVLAGTPPAIRSWLEEPGSLTARLRAATGPGFGVRVLGQKWGRPFTGEAGLLGLPPRRRVLLREVLLHDAGIPLVLARTTIPPLTLRGVHGGLARLGSRPLGELLFAYRGLRRTSLELAKIFPSQWRHPISREFGLDSPVWGRRSLYEVGSVSLAVCEFFLPGVLSLSESGT